ncbi:MAG: GIY-YIG nuclease family protein [Salibacteraceae bacterium]
MERGGYTYIMSNFERTTFYIGVSSKLSERITDHKNGDGSVFTSKYKCFYLVYYQGFQRIEEAI